VGGQARRHKAGGAQFDEKSFYLDEFRGRTLGFAVRLSDCRRRGGFAALGGVLRDLLANGTRLIVLLGARRVPDVETDAMREVARRLRPFTLSGPAAPLFAAARGRRSLASSFLDLRGDRAISRRDRLPVDAVWAVLRKRPLFVGFVSPESLVDLAGGLAVRLHLPKLVVTESAGGVSARRGVRLSFMDTSMLEAALQAGEAEWAGMAARRRTLETVRAALRGGVGAVNLCTLEGLARELFTYEGSGTLFTLEDYCRVARLGIDDFPAVERLIVRGQREGYLKERTPEEIAQILFNGYGATIGLRHLAGVCALISEPYATERAGEIAGLSTLTRFKGEGVGRRLVDRVMADAAALGLRYVFACTTEARAQAFFERQGFRPVPPDAVPASKWAGYDSRRLARLKVYRREIESPEPARATIE